MRRFWTQPSLSRDFALLAAAVLFILFLIALWVSYATYTHHAERVSNDLEKESVRIERMLEREMDDANYLLTALGRQIILNPDRSLTNLAEMLKSFDNKGYIYSIFSWIDPEERLLVSSNKGVLDKPVDVADRDYVKKSMVEPWKMNIGRPIEGRVSGRWVIPLSMGITDYTGKFIGTLVISLDINVLTDRLRGQAVADGISFAVVSRSLIPLVQVSDDKDFINDNFPVQKLFNTDFTKTPAGLVAQGGFLWGAEHYAYYRASENYPYIVLLAYDTRFSDGTLRDLLWSRLLQMLVMAIFFVLLLWVMRSRMIKPVLDMTAVTANVAGGGAFTPLPEGGPIEIEALAAQIRRMSEYLDEHRRIQDELRNKMFMLKRAKERAEMDKRGKAEFLAYVCQELRTPLNNMVGAAQVMKDQLYGPLENRKYRQYAADIYGAGNRLLEHTQDLLTLSKAEGDYIELMEKPVDVGEVVGKTLRFLADKLQAEKINIKLQLQEPMPRLVADEFRLQQILMNLLLYAMSRTLPGATVPLEAKVVSEHRDRAFFALVIGTADRPASTAAELVAAAERATQPPAFRAARDQAAEQPEIGLELARMLITLHGGWLDIFSSGGSITITALLPGSRIRFSDGQEK